MLIRKNFSIQDLQSVVKWSRKQMLVQINRWTNWTSHGPSGPIVQMTLMGKGTQFSTSSAVNANLSHARIWHGIQRSADLAREHVHCKHTKTSKLCTYDLATYTDFNGAVTMWCSYAIGRATNLRFAGHRFESWLGTIVQWPSASYLHLCASVTKQYNLVPAKRVISSAGKVTAGLVESNSNLVYDWVTRGLTPRNRDQLHAQCS